MLKIFSKYCCNEIVTKFISPLKKYIYNRHHITFLIFFLYSQFHDIYCMNNLRKYSQICIKRSPLGQRKCGLIRQEKCWPINTVDCLMEVIAKADLSSGSDCCWAPTQQFVRYIMVRTSLCSMRWWWGLFCTRTKCLVGFFIVLAHWNNSPQIDMSRHSDALSWFRAN